MRNEGVKITSPQEKQIESTYAGTKGEILFDPHLEKNNGTFIRIQAGLIDKMCIPAKTSKNY